MSKRHALPAGIAPEILRFAVVGVANTVVYYAIYRALLLVIPYVFAHTLAFVVSVVFSFFANCWFTYRVRPTWKKFFAFPASTAVNYLFTTAGSVLTIQVFGWDARYAPLAMGVLAIPITFTVARVLLVRGGESPAR